MIIDIDVLDRKIILQLDKNSRQSYSQLAKKLNTSKSVINYRVKQLEAKKIIKGYYTVIDTSKIGYYNFRIYIKLKESSKKERENIVKHLVQSKRTWWIAMTGFPYDIATIFLAKNMHEFDDVFKDFLKLFKPNILSYKVNLYVEIKHFFREYVLHDEPLEKRESMLLGGEVKVDLSSLEMKVLSELSTNSRLGTVIMAKKLNTAPITVKKIIKKLIKWKVIAGFRVLFDYSRLNYRYYWIHMNVSDYDGGEKLAKFVEMFPQTVYTDKSIGGSDVEFGI